MLDTFHNVVNDECDCSGRGLVNCLGQAGMVMCVKPSSRFQYSSCVNSRCLIGGAAVARERMDLAAQLCLAAMHTPQLVVMDNKVRYQLTLATTH